MQFILFKMDYTNYINAEIFIEKSDTYKRIINSFENFKKEKKLKDSDDDYKYENENEIKNCRILINDKEISFCYLYKFNMIGKYNIKYSFTNNLTNISYLFFGCDSLTKIDLSQLNTQYITNMTNLFSGCKILIYRILIRKMLLI